MFCMKCGTQLPEDALFCHKCGFSLSDLNNTSVASAVATNTGTKMVPARCTNCNATLEVDPNKETAICPYCQSAYIIEKAINNYNINNNITISSAALNMENATLMVNNQVNSENYIKRAISFRQAGECDKAIQYLDKVLDQDPDNSDAMSEMLKTRLVIIDHIAPYEKLDDIRKIDCNIQTKVVEEFKKAIPYDLSPGHQVIVNLLAAYGSRVEFLAMNRKGIPFFPIAIVKLIESYYKTAANLQPENNSIQLALRRIKFILNDFCYCKNKVPGTKAIAELHMLEIQIKQNDSIINKIPLKGITEVYKPDISFFGKFFMKIEGSQRPLELSVGLDNENRWISYINELKEERCSLPNYEYLINQQLVEKLGDRYNLLPMVDIETSLALMKTP